MCSNRRCLDPLLPDMAHSVSKHSPAVDNSLCCPGLGSDVVPDSSPVDSCKHLSFDETVCAEPKQDSLEAETKTDPDGTSDGSAWRSTGSLDRRTSRNFTDVTTWSQFRQRKAAALKSCLSEKVLISQLYFCISVDFD